MFAIIVVMQITVHDCIYTPIRSFSARTRPHETPRSVFLESLRRAIILPPNPACGSHR